MVLDSTTAVLKFCHNEGIHCPATTCSVVDWHDKKKLQKCTKQKVRIPHKPPKINFKSSEHDKEIKSSFKLCIMKGNIRFSFESLWSSVVVVAGWSWLAVGWSMVSSLQRSRTWFSSSSSPAAIVVAFGTGGITGIFPSFLPSSGCTAGPTVSAVVTITGSWNTRIPPPFISIVRSFRNRKTYSKSEAVAANSRKWSPGNYWSIW